MLAETAQHFDSFGAIAKGFGPGLVIGGAAYGISKVASSALDGISRQPEAAGSMFLAWLLPAVLIEGVTLFALVITLLATGQVQA